MSFRSFTIRAFLLTLAGLGLVWAIVNCSEKKADTTQTLEAWVDISFKPLIEQQHLVFNARFGKKQSTYINYVTETEAFRALLSQKTNMIVTSRPVTQQEKMYFIRQDSAVPQSAILAYDAVCILLSRDMKKNNFTMEELKDLLTRSVESPIRIIVEGKGSASSSLLFLIDKLGIPKDNVSEKIIGLSPSEQVITYVQTHANTIGIISSSYLSRMGELPQETIKKMNIRLAQVLNDSIQLYVHPVGKAGFSFASYPLVRPIYYTTLDRVSGAGIRFARFMTNEQGQLIFRKSHALPAFMNFETRNVALK